MKIKCAKCDSTMFLRNGRYGEFYVCPKSTVTESHGTLNKAKVDDYFISRLRDIDRTYAPADQEFLRHCKRMREMSATNVIDFFTDHRLMEDFETDIVLDIIPRG